MDKKKISKKRGFSFKDMPETKLQQRRPTVDWDAEDTFLDTQKVGSALLACLMENDAETFMEILDAYLRINRLQVAKKAKLSRATVQQALAPGGNPTLKTLAKIVHEATRKS